MHRYLLVLLFISQNCLSENIAEICTDKIIQQYSSEIKTAIRSNVQYPEVAQRRHREGNGAVTITLFNGTVITKKITMATGHQVLDSAMLKAIETTDLPKLSCKQTYSDNITIPFEFLLLDPKPPLADAKISTRINSYGIYSAKLEKSIHLDTVLVFRDIDQPSSPHLIEETTNIPCQIDTLFGVSFDINGLDKTHSPFKLDVQWEFTTPSGKSSPEKTFRTLNHGTKGLYLGWRLEEPFDLVTGDWSIHVYYNGTKILQKRFDLVCK